MLSFSPEHTPFIYEMVFECEVWRKKTRKACFGYQLQLALVQDTDACI